MVLVPFSDPASLSFFQWEKSGPASNIQENRLSNVIDLAMLNNSKFLHIDATENQLWFELGSPGPKAAALIVLFFSSYTPLTPYNSL